MHNSSVLSESSSSSSLIPSSSNHGLRSQLGHILPKHALFHVRMHVDQLSNVPLVSGEFGVRWKFKNVQTGAGLLSKMKHRSSSGSYVTGGKTDKGKGRDRPSMESMPEIATQGDSDSRPSYEADAESVRSTRESGERAGPAVYGQFLTASPPSTPVPSAAIPTTTKIPQTENRGEARGMTDWRQLQNYNVRWDHRVDVMVQMDVHRETSDLLPCELKLVVMQRVVHGDPNAPHQPRLGAVYLNLAEYAGAGPIARRYLLRESKTNATLKLTIDVEHVGGEKNFTPPPLRKSEIMASVTGLLSNNDIYNTKLARNLDLYARADDEDWEASFQRTPVQTFWNADGHVDFNRLAANDGLRTTENLIDALFNPVPTTSPNSSPFTYYDPDRAQEVERQVSAVERQSTHSSVESGYTDGSSHPSSVFTSGSDHSSGNGSVLGQESHKHWWQKIRNSRPSTPADKHPRPFTPHINTFPRVPS